LQQEHVLMNWTDERVELLKKLWAEGLSASQIAAQLGGVSRNAVIGKVHRLKLSARGRAAGAPTRQKKAAAAPGSGASSAPARRQRTARPVATSVGATALKVQFEEDAVAYRYLRPVEDVVLPMSRNLKLVELTERTCKWPNGDPLAEDFSFCGNDAGESGPYCSYHSRLAYQPVSERRRSR
jgi:GcrA cell cycle regulator